MSLKLSILICSITKREDNFLKDLLIRFNNQIEGKYKEETQIVDYYRIITRTYKEVELIICIDDKQMTVGAKRNLLKSLAKGDRITYFDDDDIPAPEYWPYLKEAINKTDYDVINFFVLFTHGKKKKIVEYNLEHGDRETKERFFRTSNHLMCIRRSIANKISFPDKSFAEDAMFAKKLKRHARTQGLIEKILYYYNFSHFTSETQ